MLTVTITDSARSVIATQSVPTPADAWLFLLPKLPKSQAGNRIEIRSTSAASNYHFEYECLHTNALNAVIDRANVARIFGVGVGGGMTEKRNADNPSDAWRELREIMQFMATNERTYIRPATGPDMIEFRCLIGH